MLQWKPISMEDEQLIKAFSYQYGGRSCQNSFVSWILRKEKYNDCFGIINNFLVVCRKGIETEGEKKYLFPMGDTKDKAALKDCINQLRQDAREAGKRLCFCSVTDDNIEALKELFSGEFDLTENRDYFEYIFSTTKMSTFSGKKLEDRRWQVNRFERLYKDRYTISCITLEELPEISAFREKMIGAKGGELAPELLNENMAFDRAMKYYNELSLVGIVVRLDEEICGYSIGVKIGEDTIDGLFMKGDRKVKYINTILFQKFAVYCCKDAVYINGEEDVGVEGLRTAKLKLQPEYILKKYIVCFE